MKKQHIIIFLLPLIFLMNNCSYKDVYTEPGLNKDKSVKQTAQEQPAKKEAQTTPLTSKPLQDLTQNKVYQRGIASWYGRKFNGKRTANGEIYNMHRLTAAHKQLPFNTILEVKNLENSKKVLVRINDRGPFVKNRILDLSYKAAKIIGVDGPGTAPVELRVIKKGEIRVKEIRRENKSGFYIQAGAFSLKKNCISILKRIKRIAPEAGFRILKDGDIFRIISGRFMLKKSAEKIVEMLDRNDIESFTREYF